MGLRPEAPTELHRPLSTTQRREENHETRGQGRHHVLNNASTGHWLSSGHPQGSRPSRSKSSSHPFSAGNEAIFPRKHKLRQSGVSRSIGNKSSNPARSSGESAANSDRARRDPRLALTRCYADSGAAVATWVKPSTGFEGLLRSRWRCPEEPRFPPDSSL